MTETPMQIVGMVWYRAEDYDAIRRIMADGHKLPATFDEWRPKAEAGEQRLRVEGKTVFRAFVDPETFPDWCRTRGLDIDAKARNLFAGQIAYQLATGGHGDGGDGLH